MNKLLLLILIFPGLIGCSARLVSADHKDVVVANVNKSTEGDAYRIADKECAKYDKQAFRLSYDKTAATATYRCIDHY